MNEADSEKNSNIIKIFFAFGSERFSPKYVKLFNEHLSSKIFGEKI